MASLRRERCLRAERRDVPRMPPPALMPPSCAEREEAEGANEAGPAKPEDAARLEGAARLMAVPPLGESCRPSESKEAGRLSASPADSGETNDTDRPLAAVAGVTGAPSGCACWPAAAAPPLPAASAAKREGGRRTVGASGERARGGVRAPPSSSSWNRLSSRRLASEPAMLSLKAEEARSLAAVGEVDASEAEPEEQQEEGHCASSSYSMLSIATTPSSAAAGGWVGGTGQDQSSFTGKHCAAGVR